MQRVVAWLLAMRRAVRDDNGARKVYAHRATIVGNIWMSMAVFISMAWDVEPLFSQTTPALNGSTADPALPIPAWLPFDASPPATYGLTFTLEAIICAWTVFATIFVDVLYAKLIINFAAELHVLNDNVEMTGNGADFGAHQNRKIDVAHHVGTSSGGANHDELAAIPNLFSVQFAAANGLMPAYVPKHFEVEICEGNDTYQSLVKNIQHHQLIIKCVDEFEKATAIPVLLVVSSNVWNLCSNIISLAMMLEQDPRVSTVAKTSVFTLGFVIQTALYCLPGQIIIDESERLIHSAFSCRWPDADGRFKSSLLIFMIRVGQPLRLRVGKLVTISRETFQELLKLSYQLFNLVYQLQSS